jgi:hypothetical protein
MESMMSNCDTAVRELTANELDLISGGSQRTVNIGPLWISTDTTNGSLGLGITGLGGVILERGGNVLTCPDSGRCT